MIGIGVGIDYALFIVTRYREGLHDGRDAARRRWCTAIDTAGPGRALRRLHRGHLAAGHVRSSASSSSAAWPSAPRPCVLGDLLASRHACCPPCSGSSAATSTSSRLPGMRQDAPTQRRACGYRWCRVAAAPPLAVRRRRASSSCWCWPCPCSPSRLGVVDDGNDPDRADHPPGLRPARRGLRPRGQRAAAGGGRDRRPAATCRRCSKLARRAGRHRGVAQVSPARPNQAGDAAVIQVIPTTSPQDAGTTDLVAPPPRRRGAPGHRGHRRDRSTSAASPRRSTTWPPAAGPPAVLHRRRAEPQLPAAAGGVPLDPRAAQGRDHEPAVDRRGLRRDGRRLPVGLGQGPHRRGQAGPIEALHAR